MLRCRFFIVALVLAGGIYPSRPAWCQSTEAVQQKNLSVAKLLTLEESRLKNAKHGLASRVSLFMGYETNAALEGTRKGDFFNGVTFSTSYNKPLTNLAQLLVRYDLFDYTYHELTDNSYLLNNLSTQWAYRLPFGRMGAGLDTAYVSYFRNEEAEFLYPRGYVFLRHNFAKRYYQQWDAEVSLRHYTREKALADTLDTFQDEKRLDQQLGVSYQIGGFFGKKIFAFIKAKYATNDSNADFQEYYDYISWRGEMGLTYQLTVKDQVFTGASFTRRDYGDRLTLDNTSHQRNELYSATAGVRHAIDKTTYVSLSYRYLENLSNEPSEEYSDSITTMSLSHQF
jgi:hypothetical protein